MKRVCWTLTAALAMAGCATQAQMLDDRQPMAMQTAVSRAQFEMNCQQATGEVLSREVVQPAFARGIQRNEYTIGVSGCGKRSVYTVICPQGGENCFAADPGQFPRR